ncbi:MAG: SagB/ThcOx family dehydrogenase [Deltaproteobacteria bacterium]|nr:SagB/ThcOx family dehydrogenase [Deltaproteobacteria bacterium]
MKNRNLESAWAYHNGTKHSYQSIRTNAHHLDWENQPIPFKIYSKLEPIPLPQHLSPSGRPALSAISVVNTPAETQQGLAVQTLAEILYLSAGITKRKSYPGGEILFRAAACTGALYHIDLYVVCGDLPGLEAGVYHFGPHDFALRRLRKGDYRAVIARASGEEASIVNAPAVVTCASTYWRNAWKYQARAYRHCYWDNGTILANFLAAAAARKLPAKVVVGFVDATVNQLLGLDTNREAALTLVALGDHASEGVKSSAAVEPLALETMRLSKEEIDYPAIRAMHEASSLESEAEVATWRREAQQEGDKRAHGGEEEKRLFLLRPLSDEAIPQDTIEQVIQRRGSTRQCSHESITFTQLSTMLDRATRRIPADFLNETEASLNDVYLIVHAVEDLPPGAYLFRRERRAVELLKEGNFRREAGYLGLGQEIPADCSVDVFFLADLNHALERFGNRGYRAAQLEASIMGGKLYLSAYAQRLGASGLTFFDDDVTDFFSPHGAGKSVMFLIALGKSAKPKKGLTVI